MYCPRPSRSGSLQNRAVNPSRMSCNACFAFSWSTYQEFCRLTISREYSCADTIVLSLSFSVAVMESSKNFDRRIWDTRFIYQWLDCNYVT